MVHFSDLGCETVTHGSLYKLAMLNSPQNSHLGTLNISPTWRIHFCSNLWGWKEYISGYFSEVSECKELKIWRYNIINISHFCRRNWKTRASCFHKRSTLDSSP